MLLINAISILRRTLLKGIKDASLSIKEEGYLSGYILEGYFRSKIIGSYGMHGCSRVAAELRRVAAELQPRSLSYNRNKVLIIGKPNNKLIMLPLLGTL